MSRIKDASHKPTAKMFSSARAMLKDGWTNIFTSLGRANKDKRSGNRAAPMSPLTEVEVEDIYTADALARRICGILPFEAFREGFTITGVPSDDESKLMAYLEQRGTFTHFPDGWEDARLYGGAGIFCNWDDGKSFEEPLDPNKIKTLKSMTVLNRHELWIPMDAVETNLDSPDFGKPKWYELQPRAVMATVDNKKRSALSIRVHASRIIRFDGVKLPSRKKVDNNHWDDSIFTSILEALQDFGVSHGYVANIIHDFRVAVYKMTNLGDLLAAGKDELVTKRIQVMNLARSILGAVVVGEGEEFEFNTGSVAGLADLVDRLKTRLQSATDIPHTILFNESASGLGATGESERKNWFQYVSAQQNTYLKPRLKAFLSHVFMAKDCPVKPKEGWDIKFNSLDKPTDKEQVETRKAQAETDAAYIDRGVLSPEEIRESRFGGDTYSLETTLDDSSFDAAKEAEAKEAEAAAKAALAAANNPPPPARGGSPPDKE